MAACRSKSGLEETTTSARPVGGGAGVAYGNCVEARKRAAETPDLDVDSLPRVLRQRPAPLTNIPPAVKSQLNAKGAAVKIDVVVDTMGRANMKTFKVVESSHQWLGENLRAVIPKWTFKPAYLAGCRVPRVYKFSATSKPRKA